MSAPDAQIPQDDAAQAAEYALGLLSPSEAAAFEARLAQAPELRALYAAWAKDFAHLTDDIAPQAPPPRVWHRIAGPLFAGRGGLLWLGLIGLGAAALMAIVLIGAPAPRP